MDYELMLILKPLLPEDIKTGVINSIEKLVKKFKGEIKGTDVWGKRHLAYPINKHEEGYYMIYNVNIDPEHSVEFDRQLKLTNGVLRFLKIKKTEI